MSNDLSKATLERKDKDELTQIAQAMGGKPTSRARKADIIELIMELAGVPDASGEVGSTDSGGKSSSDDASASDEGPSAGPGSEADADSGGSRDSDDKGGSSENGKRSGSSAASYSADPMADARAAESRENGQGGDGGQGQDSSEQGGRRRRRRGRNRDRNDNTEEWAGEPVEVEGHLDLRDDGYGFLRVNGFLPSKEDVYVSVKQVRQFELRKGDHLSGAGRPANRSEKNPALVRIDAVNGREPEQAVNRAHFDELTPVHPTEQLRLERGDEPDDMTGRLIDLVAPIGKGQRGILLAPPLADKMAVLKQVARSIETNHPEVTLLVLLIDERPEDVTEMQRWLARGEVISCTFDRPADEHVTVAELTAERARRMVESGHDVVLLLDGLTRLARAYNTSSGGSSRAQGGLDPAALHQPKRLFGAARNIEEGGSLTILATARVDSGSALDQAILDEFAETANMTLKLDRRAAERRLRPPVDLAASGTRRADLLLGEAEAEAVLALRDRLADADDDPAAGLSMVLDQLHANGDNDAFFAQMSKA